MIRNYSLDRLSAGTFPPDIITFAVMIDEAVPSSGQIEGEELDDITVKTEGSYYIYESTETDEWLAAEDYRDAIDGNPQRLFLAAKTTITYPDGTFSGWLEGQFYETILPALPRFGELWNEDGVKHYTEGVNHARDEGLSIKHDGVIVWDYYTLDGLTQIKHQRDVGWCSWSVPLL